MGTLGCAKQSIDYSNRKKSGQEWGACGAPCERAGGGCSRVRSACPTGSSSRAQSSTPSGRRSRPCRPSAAPPRHTLREQESSVSPRAAQRHPQQPSTSAAPAQPPPARPSPAQPSPARPSPARPSPAGPRCPAAPSAHLRLPRCAGVELICFLAAGMGLVLETTLVTQGRFSAQEVGGGTADPKGYSAHPQYIKPGEEERQGKRSERWCLSSQVTVTREGALLS